MTAFVLKLIALVTMIIDHSAAVLNESMPTAYLSQNVYLLLREIGRVAFPLYAFMLVEGFRHTRDWHKYALRLFGLALLSQIPYAFTVNAGRLLYDLPLWRCFTDLNILFTLTFGVLMLAFMNTKKLDKLFDSWGAAILFGALAVLFYLSHLPDLALALGVSAILTAAARFSPKCNAYAGQAARFALFGFVLFWMLHKNIVLLFADMTIHFSFDYDLLAIVLFAALYWAKTPRRSAAVLAVWAFWAYWGFAGEIVCALIAAVLVFWYNGEKGRNDHRLFYWAYPAHLFALWGVLALLGG